MKSIRKEMTRNHLILLLVVFIFIAPNALVDVDSSRRYNGLLQGYQQVNGLLAVNNRRQTYFRLYSKSHDKGTLKRYYDECRLSDSQLRGLDDKAQNDRECKMMYRIMGQVTEYKRETAESYIRPDGDYYPSLVADLDKVNLEIERYLNQLMSQYLEYLDTAFASHNRTLGLTSSILIVFFIAASLFSVVLNHQVNTSTLNSVKRLTDTAREIMNNNLETAGIKETPYTELNQISAIFNQMKRQVRTMITGLHETRRMKERLAEAKIRELRMQMNPHFLFNTLSLIIRSIRLGERNTSIQLVEAISRILRSSIEINTVSTPLDEEIELLQSYLYMQKPHLKRRVTFCLDVRKSFTGEDVIIPPLTIQPLMENSIQHGLGNRVSGGKVDILITEKPDYIEAVVMDNSTGFPKNPDQPSLRETPIPETSIGLRSVEEQLRLFYREEDVLQVKRTEGITKITLKLYRSGRHQKERVMLCVILIDDKRYERSYLKKVIEESYLGLLEIVCRAMDDMDLLGELEECKPQIVLLDIKMPWIGGLKIAEEVRKRYPNIQIVLIPTYSGFSFTKQAVKLGATDYLLKPYLDSELKETLDRVIARVRERENILFMLSYSNCLVEGGEAALDLYRGLEKGLLWDVFSGRRDRDKLEKEFAMWGVEAGWFKVVLISSPALINIGGFFQEVLKNYFHVAGVTVLDSIWIDQMVICLYSQQQDAFAGLTDCITRARGYLAGERKVPVTCGVSGAYEGMERLTRVYGEAASFIRECSAQEARLAFDSMTKGMKRVCGLEEQIVRFLSRGDQSQTSDLLTEMIGELETLLGCQDVSVRLNFGRSLMTTTRGINQIPGIRVETSEATRHFEKLGQLNSNGDNLEYHVDYFSEMKIQRE